MLKFTRIEIENFVIFPYLNLEPSIVSDKPLTIIRAENGSGKTTLLRAIKWCLYGEQGLPHHDNTYPIHLRSLDPTERDINTRVSIEFQVDNAAETYRLQRYTTTTKSRVDGPQNFERRSEQVTIKSKKRGTTRWNEHPLGVDSIIAHYMPWGLRNFFIMDTDEVAEYVGGAENADLRPKEIRERTTDAIESLLGLDVCEAARARTQRIANEYEKETAEKSKSAHIQSVQRDLNRTREDLEELRTQREVLDRVGDELQTERNELRKEQDQILMQVGNVDELRARIKTNSSQLATAVRNHQRAQKGLSQLLDSREIFHALTQDYIKQSMPKLQPEKTDGEVPVQQLGFIQELLGNGRCVCGQDLASQGDHRKQIQAVIRKTKKKEKQAGFLEQVYDAAKVFQAQSGPNNIPEQVASLRQEISISVAEIADLETEHADLEKRLSNVDDDKLQAIRKRIEIADHRLRDNDHQRGMNDNRQQEENAMRITLERELNELLRGATVARVSMGCTQVANMMVQIFQNVYQSISRNQIPALSQDMNRFFLHMAANVSDSDFINVETAGRSIRMIDQVSIEPAGGSDRQFEIVVRNNRGESLSPTEINGASRRIIALAFVLAMCEGSQSHNPLIADSLLNFMSGKVRTNTFRTVTEHSEQPILLLTGSDLSSDSELEIALDKGGAFYTLTGQWDAIDAGAGGDVINLTEDAEVSLLCECGPRQYCSICEREGWREQPDWKERRSQ